MKNPLRQFRFSLTTLFGATLFMACVVATLRYTTRLWADAIFTLALAVTALAALGAIYRKGANRAFWVGALFGGGGYLFLAYGPWIGESVRPHLITTPLLLAAQERMQAMFNPPVVVGFSWPTMPSAGVPSTVYSTPADANPLGAATTVDPSVSYGNSTTIDFNGIPFTTFSATTYSAATISTSGLPDWNNLERAGHSLTALLAALVFGKVASRFHRTSLTTEANKSEHRGPAAVA